MPKYPELDQRILEWFTEQRSQGKFSVEQQKHDQINQLIAERIERFSYDLEMKTREQNRNNKRTEIERFDWCIERIQTHLAFGWLSERSGKQTS